jgi:hypothetical protein
MRQASQPSLIDQRGATAHKSEPQAHIRVNPDRASAVAMACGLLPGESEAFLAAKLVDHDDLEVSESAIVELKLGVLTVENKESHVRISFKIVRISTEASSQKRPQ